jgi:uncharacterized membrane-anchored protein YjiN (DUF445 family)
LVAVLLLLVMAAGFGVSVAFRPVLPQLAWVEAFTEAALVGGIADWFAIVALFRRPLGLPFPHSAIVPRNKDRIGAALGRFVAGHFLTRENIARRLENLDLAGHAIRWMAEPAHAAEAAGALAGLAPRLIEAIDDGAVGAALASGIRGRLDRLDAASLIARALDVLAREGRHQPLLDDMLARLGLWLEGNRDMLKARFASRSRLTPRFVDTYIVNAFVDGVIDLFAEVGRDPDHELRRGFDAGVADLVARLGTDPALRARIEGLKAEMIDRLGVEDFVLSLWVDLKTRIAAKPARFEAPLAGAIAGAAARLAQDPALIARLDATLRDLIEAGVERFGLQISTLIEEVVRRWDARQIADRLELEVGADLQFIRLNGTLVGGLVGVVLHGVRLLF